MKCEWCGKPISCRHGNREQGRIYQSALSGRDYGFCSDKCQHEHSVYVPVSVGGNSRRTGYDPGDFDSWGRIVRLLEDAACG